jgi:hypothetical protein
MNDMKPAPTPHGADRSSSGRRYSGALVLLAITVLLVACGGGGAGERGTASTSTATATLAWDATSAVTGYRIYFGTQSGTYPQSLDVGNVTTYTVTGLSSGTRYYFAATAYDENTESNLSNEVFKDMP